MESLECPNALAKQVLSQLSYTPADRQHEFNGFFVGTTSCFFSRCSRKAGYMAFGAAAVLPGSWQLLRRDCDAAGDFAAAHFIEDFIDLRERAGCYFAVEFSLRG